MCRPIPGNCVRPKFDCKVKPLPGSTGIATGKSITLKRETEGIAERELKDDPDRFIILFEQDGALIRTVMKHDQLKGVEA